MVKSYKHDRMLETRLERLLPPVLTYVVRKIVLYGVKANLRVLKLVSDLFMLDFAAGVSDRDTWCWNLREKMPLYKAKVEKVD